MKDNTTPPIPRKNPDFESIKRIDNQGEESWEARQLMPLLDYMKWENFESRHQKSPAGGQKQRRASGKPFS